MNHPKPEEWVPYLFGETQPQERRRLQQHLQSCAGCRHEVETWECNLKRLDAWKLPPSGRAREPQPFLGWATAAAMVLVLALGIVAGRLSSGAVDSRKIQAAIEPELRRQLAQMWRQELEKTTAATLAMAHRQAQQLVVNYDQASGAQRAGELQALYGSLDKLAARHLSDFISLKKDVDTVAVMTDAGLRRTEQQLVQFADFTQPVRPTNSPK
jgi:hypothetical protein